MSIPNLASYLPQRAEKGKQITKIITFVLVAPVNERLQRIHGTLEDPLGLAGCGEEFASRGSTNVFMHKAAAEKFFPGCQYAVRDAHVYSLASLVYKHHDKASILELYTFYCQQPMVAFRAPHPRSSQGSVARRNERQQLERDFPGCFGPPARGGGKDKGQRPPARGGGKDKGKDKGREPPPLVRPRPPPRV